MFWRRRGRDNAEAERTFPTPTPPGDTEPQEAVAEDPPAERKSAEGAPAEVEHPEESRVEEGPIELERDAPRPYAIQHAAEELSRRGGRVVELFKEVRSPKGRANLAIYLLRGSEPEERVFVEVSTGPWDEAAVAGAARTAAILRGSEQADATLEFLSAYPLPDEVRFTQERSALALMRLDLVDADLEEPEAFAEAFRDASNRHWGLSLDYETADLPLVEELLASALNERSEWTTGRVLEPLVHGLGCYVGEILRRRAPQGGSWRPAGEWGEGIVVEFGDLTADPIGQARAFVENGPEDSVAFYADYVLKELRGAGTNPGAPS